MKSLFHYTPLEALQSIVNNGQLTFWAFHIQSMNDTTEYAFIKQKLTDELIAYDQQAHQGDKSEAIKRNIEHLFSTSYLADPYIVSLCKNREDRNMWENYANYGTGVCLQFSHNELLTLETKDILLRECIYVSRDENYLSERSLNDLYNYLISIPQSPQIIPIHPQWLQYVDHLSRTKQKKYEYEAECRLIRTSEIRPFRTNDNRNRPYITISIPSSALQSITIGPQCPNRTEATDIIRCLLTEQLGIDETQRITLN